MLTPGAAKPEPLGSEKVRADGAVGQATGEVHQFAGLTPDTHPEVAGVLAVRPDAIAEAELADVEVVTVEAWALEARSEWPVSEVAIVKAIVQIDRLRRREASS